MEAALKDIFVPELKKRGFKGSFPHFRRVTENSLDLLTFQFYSSGGSFIIEIGQCPAEGFTNAAGMLTPAEKVKVMHVWPRLRLGSSPERGINDHWFHFGEPSYEPSIPRPVTHYESIANSAIGFISSQAEPWWAHNKSFKADA